MNEDDARKTVRRGASRRRELGRYVLWQLPSWGILGLVLLWLTRVASLGEWVAAAVFCLFVAKDLALFPAMRTAFRPSPSPGHVGERGEALEPLNPSGYIRIKGELWRAEACRPGRWIPEGSTVVVRELRGLTLLVEEDLEPPAEAR